MGVMNKAISEASQICLNCKHRKIRHLIPITNQSGRMNVKYGTCKECKKENKEKICHVFKTKNS